MRRHELDLVALIAGLIFTGLAVAYVVGAYTDLRLDPRYVFPLVVIGLGVAGLAASIVGQRRTDQAALAAAEVAPREADGPTG